jgi:hypothetical protein
MDGEHVNINPTYSSEIGAQRAAPKSVAAIEAEREQLVTMLNGESFESEFPRVEYYQPSSLLLPPSGTPDHTEPWDFARYKQVVLEDGPLDKCMVRACIIDPDGLLYFFRNNGRGEIEQAVYRVALVEKERTAEEVKAGKAREWDWVGQYVGKRRVITRMVSGVMKGPSPQQAASL